MPKYSAEHKITTGGGQSENARLRVRETAHALEIARLPFGVQAHQAPRKRNDHKSSQTLRRFALTIATSPIQRAGHPHLVSRYCSPWPWWDGLSPSIKALIVEAGPPERERTDRRRACQRNRAQAANTCKGVCIRKETG
jgi:hypothetical protein